MAVILYPSGVTENLMANKHTFTDEEILKIFEEYDLLRTARLYEVPNTWCVWGDSDDENNFNKLGSDILQEHVFSEVMFIHDTEIDPSWMLTDNIILKGYEEFRVQLLQFFDDIAENVIKETQRMRKEEGIPDDLVLLNTIGPSEDKRVLFELDPHKQSKEFWSDKHFEQFARKVILFLEKYYKDGDTFVIWADKKSIIVIADENVEFIMNKIIADFERRERYERCDQLAKILKGWKKYKAKKKKQDDDERK